MASIYRKSSLEKLSSPEQLDRMIVVTSPTFWLAMAGAGAIILVALIWSIVGRLPVTVQGNGIYINREGIGTVYSDAAGVINSIEVSVGDTVSEGDVIATLTDSDTQSTIDDLTERLQIAEAITISSTDDVSNADTRDLLEIKTSLDSVDSSLRQSMTSLSVWKQEYAQASAELASLSTQLDAAKAAYEEALGANSDGSTVEIEYNNASSAYEEAKSKLNSAQATLSSMQAAYDAAVTGLNTCDAAVSSAQNNVNTAQAAVDDAQKKLDADPENETLKRELENAKAALSEAQTVLADANSQREAFLNGASQAGGTNRTLINNYYPDAQTAVSDAQNALNSAKSTYEEKQKAYQEYLSAKSSSDVDLQRKQTEYSDLSTQYSTKQSEVTSLEQNIASVEAQIAAEQSNTGTQLNTLMQQFDNARSALISSLESELEQAQRTMNKTRLVAHQSGTVVEVPVSKGTLVSQGSEILKLSSDTNADTADSNVVVCYVPLTSGKKITEGMTVMVYPTTLNKQEYGHMEATVLSVDQYVTSTTQMKNTLGDDLLVNSFTQDGPVIAVTCALRTDETTASGYYWSSKKAADILIAEGTLVTVDIVTERKAPIQMVIPLLKEKLSLASEPSEE